MNGRGKGPAEGAGSDIADKAVLKGLRAAEEISHSGGERVVLSIKPSVWFVLLRSWWVVVLAVVVGFGARWALGFAGVRSAGWAGLITLVVIVLVVVWQALEWASRSYLVTDRRIVRRAGVLRRDIADLPLRNVQHVTVHRSLMERILGVGSVGLNTSGTAWTEVYFVHVDEPEEVMRKVRGAMDGDGEGEPAGRAEPPPARGLATPSAGAERDERARGASVASGERRKEAGAASSGGVEEEALTLPSPGGIAAFPGEGTRNSNDPLRLARGAGETPPPSVTGEEGVLVIGLVGGIGAGKSAVAGVMREMGAVVIDSDKEAKEVLLRPEVREALVGWWGSDVLDAEGKVDRAAVAKIVFERPEERQRLEGLVHPLVKGRRAALIERARREGKTVAVVDAPLLLEAGVDAECDVVVFVDAPREERLRRVRETRGWDEGELERREKAQWSLERKRRESDDVIVNDGDREALRARVAEVMARAEARGR